MAANARIREALTAGTAVKEKGPPVADGVLTVTPDTPEVAEWRSKSPLDCVATTSTYLEDEDDAKTPNELFGKFTWKIENFSDISKRELRSNQFDVGDYKWYILVYPQGCDVCNHLSLFLCVADYDKLLPGWSHFAQFTIAVVNKDPKKSKYSDTLHRFCKKEHDWGWKKFMELSKVLDGFTVADTLVIKAQVQVIIDKPGRLFRCLDPQYRRELVRVYLTNVESICRRFCEDKRTRLAWLRSEATTFRTWWDTLGDEARRQLTAERSELVLKGLLKQFFNEKEVTSTLVMDALFCGCRQVEEYTRMWAEGRGSEGAPSVAIHVDSGVFSFGGGVLEVAERAGRDFIPTYRDEKPALGADGLALRTGHEGDADFRRDSVERDEKRLAELGRRTVEMFAIAHIFTEKLEIAYRHDQALKRQELLIAEEEEAGRLEEQRQAEKLAVEKEKRAKKKERQKAKKEAERVRREAEEAQRARLEEARRVDMERRYAEAMERRRVEEAAAQALLQQQLQQKRQRQADKERRRAEEEAAAASKRQLQQQQQGGDEREEASSSDGDASAPSLAAKMGCATPAPAHAGAGAPGGDVGGGHSSGGGGSGGGGGRSLSPGRAASHSGASHRGSAGQQPAASSAGSAGAASLAVADGSSDAADSWDGASIASSSDATAATAGARPGVGSGGGGSGAGVSVRGGGGSGAGAVGNGDTAARATSGAAAATRDRELEAEVVGLRQQVTRLEALLADKSLRLEEREAEVQALRAQLAEPSRLIHGGWAGGSKDAAAAARGGGSGSGGRADDAPSTAQPPALAVAKPAANGGSPALLAAIAPGSGGGGGAWGAGALSSRDAAPLSPVSSQGSAAATPTAAAAAASTAAGGLPNGKEAPARRPGGLGGGPQPAHTGAESGPGPQQQQAMPSHQPQPAIGRPQASSNAAATAAAVAARLTPGALSAQAGGATAAVPANGGSGSGGAPSAAGSQPTSPALAAAPPSSTTPPGALGSAPATASSPLIRGTSAAATDTGARQAAAAAPPSSGSFSMASSTPGARGGGGGGATTIGPSMKAATAPYIAVSSSSAIAQNGLGGVLHGSGGSQDVLPPYRNAPGAAAGLAAPPPAGGSAGARGGGVASDHAFAFDGGLAGQARGLGAFSRAPPGGGDGGGGGHRASLGGLDNPGLDDFAHMNLIDDLLTE